MRIERSKKRPKFEVTITGPAGGSKERLLETLRENGYSVENKRIKGRDVVQVDVLAPWHEVNR